MVKVEQVVCFEYRFWPFARDAADGVAARTGERIGVFLPSGAGTAGPFLVHRQAAGVFGETLLYSAGPS